MKKRFSHLFALLLTLSLVFAGIPVAQASAAERAVILPESITSSCNSPGNYQSEYEELPQNAGKYFASVKQHYYQDITLVLNFDTTSSNALSVSINDKEFAPDSYTVSKGDGFTQLKIELKEVSAYFIPIYDSRIYIDVTYGTQRSIELKAVKEQYPDTTKPYIAGRSSWSFSNEQLPNTYSQTVTAKIKHYAIYRFEGALILPDFVSYEVYVDGKPFDDLTIEKSSSLGYGLMFCKFGSDHLFSARNPDPDAYTTIDIVGTNAAGNVSHTYLKVMIYPYG